jgi:NADH:ubiquinone oxidoreductase subunit 4 (subunit M)
MDFLRAHLLSIITYTPLVGATLLLFPLFKKNDDAVRWFANAVAFVGFLVSLPLWFWFDRSHPTPFQAWTASARSSSS